MDVECSYKATSTSPNFKTKVYGLRKRRREQEHYLLMYRKRENQRFICVCLRENLGGGERERCPKKFL